MASLCLTAGTELADILWAANVLPALRRTAPGLRLLWECPVPSITAWLASYPELDEVVAEVEALAEPPDDYLILHPQWQKEPEQALAALWPPLARWCGPPASLPVRPYCSLTPDQLPRPTGLPDAYICLDPSTFMGGQQNPIAALDWPDFFARVGLPIVQVGPVQVPLLPEAIEARGTEVRELAGMLLKARLTIGGDSDVSCLAHTLGRPQLWFVPAMSDWYWPRGAPPLCSCHDPAEVADLPGLIGGALYAT